MSKATIAAIAAASAATGAGITALLYSSPSSSRPQQQQQQQQQQKQLPPPSQPAVTTPPTAIPPPSLANTPIGKPDAGSPVDPSGIYQYGFPGPVADTITAVPLTGAYDRRTRNPAWVAEHITPYSLSLKNADRKHSTFVEDTNIPAAFRARLSDYFRSGYDRGHQVPAADAKWSQDAMDGTFGLSNMCPQVGEGFNRDYWAHFEDFGRNLTKRYPSVRIVTGPLYLPHRDPDGKWRVSYEVIGNPPNVAVPTHFYKVIYAEDGTGSPSSKVSLGAFVLPNARIPNDKRLAEFEVPLEVVERASGLEFASKLEPSRRKRLCQEIKCDIVVREFNNAKNRA
ncbi:DNA/RNA non-specific endonuclease [Aspergillus clavatus NRRL 1]|uniref:Endonuclease n=1 Tax=Aspergillus clavatus (strain ATCC 1007 / CBS 513.65 / DSM 816 / NCTC 3887 / NRRL 1 / QM 1276 / 107) TaxID=344612 RepID=A1CST9_ASPCL|nr:mitochondrial inner membrane nuclease Nuc1, putative [Aspergillus clavatus NRRL 1]EAW06376.1 mitochondrial inner membrane nuclease Nuc1, putative [Aspergillus clavatus NRRL 1]